jgi:hydrogenase-4 transcriptional activator
MNRIMEYARPRTFVLTRCVMYDLTNLKEFERQHILQTLTLTDWHIEGPEGAAARLGLPPSTLRSRMKQFGMKRPSAR